MQEVSHYHCVLQVHVEKVTGIRHVPHLRRLKGLRQLVSQLSLGVDGEDPGDGDADRSIGEHILKNGFSLS